MGLDPGSPGSRPGPKADAKPLSHPGIPYHFSFNCIFFLQTCLFLCICIYPNFPISCFCFFFFYSCLFVLFDKAYTKLSEVKTIAIFKNCYFYFFLYSLIFLLGWKLTNIFPELFSFTELLNNVFYWLLSMCQALC